MPPTPVFLPGKYYRQRSLVSYVPRGHKESDEAEQLRAREEKDTTILTQRLRRTSSSARDNRRHEVRSLKNE